MQKQAYSGIDFILFSNLKFFNIFLHINASNPLSDKKCEFGAKIYIFP